MQDRRNADPGRSGETSDIGDRTACSDAVSQGWLIVEDDVLTLTTAGLAAA